MRDNAYNARHPPATMGRARLLFSPGTCVCVVSLVVCVLGSAVVPVAGGEDDGWRSGIAVRSQASHQVNATVATRHLLFTQRVRFKGQVDNVVDTSVPVSMGIGRLLPFGLPLCIKMCVYI